MDRAALVDAICGWGWDHASAVTPAGAEAAAAAAPPELVRGDLVVACITGDVDAVRDLLAGDPARATAPAAVLHLAARGWPLDARGWMSATPLHWAACRGNAALARALVARGAPQLDVGGYFRTPLHTAQHCRWGSRGAPDWDGVIDALRPR